MVYSFHLYTSFYKWIYQVDMNRRLKYFIWDIQYYFNRRLCRDCYRRVWYGGRWDIYGRKVHDKCGEMRCIGFVPNDSIRRKSKWRFWD